MRLMDKPIAGWLVVLAVVVVWDAVAIRGGHPTLSEAARRARKRGWQASLIVGAGEALRHHLFRDEG